MKKSIVIILFIVLVSSLLANPMQKNKIELDSGIMVAKNFSETRREAPQLSFEVTPQLITSSNYYDYVPGANNGCPIDRQPEVLENGLPAGGYYLTYHAKENAGSVRRVYQTYINSDGAAYSPASITTTNIVEGYTTLAIDPKTGDPIIVWHTDNDNDIPYEVMFTYDMFNVVGMPGLWKIPMTLIDNPIEEYLPWDDFNWPVIKIGPSPDPTKSRAHVYTNNFTGNTNYNSLYGYADFFYDETVFDLTFTEWSWQTFPVFDTWETEDTKRMHKDIVVSHTDGQVAFVGYANDSLFCLLSDNYGEDFEVHLQEGKWPVFNPQNTDGDYTYLDEGDVPADIFFALSPNGGHFNATFVDNNSAIVFLSAMGLYSEESMPVGSYWPYPMPPKILRFDIETLEYNFVDIELIGVDAYDDQPCIPWDMNEDGDVDGYDDSGNVEMANVWPSFFYSGDYGSAFEYAMFRVSENDNIIVAVYSSGANAMLAYNEVDGYEDWFEKPEIMVCVSLDYGVTWSDPARMNNVESSEFYNSDLDGMLPCYIYPTDTFDMIDETHIGLPIMFLDDNSYGSNTPIGNGLPNGSSVMYAELNIDISPLSDATDPSVPQLVAELYQNYPNPFNPSTKISFNIKETGNVSLEIYNVKGQRVKTLVNGMLDAGSHDVIWDGLDDMGSAVSSGVYFYKMKTASTSNVHKMLLLK